MSLYNYVPAREHLGQLMTDQLAGASLPPALQKIVAGGGRLTGAMVQQMPPAARLSYEQAYVSALTPVFLVAACVCIGKLLGAQL